MQPSLVIASGNPGKIREIQAILRQLGSRVVSAADLGISLDVKETGDSYAANARLKAEAYQSATGLPVLADDSGLEVAALGGAPSIHSARYAPMANASDADRRAHLLKQLQGLPRPWEAQFVCTAVVALPDGARLEAVGRCPGEIIPVERGRGGFGYDPVFYLPTHQATMAELPPDLKNQISHRAKAIRALLPKLLPLFSGE